MSCRGEAYDPPIITATLNYIINYKIIMMEFKMVLSLLLNYN